MTATFCEAPPAAAAAVTFTVPGDPVAQLSPNLRIHWRERAQRVADWRSRMRLYWRQAGSPRFDVPVEVEILVRRGRVCDDDNATASLKACRDSLCDETGPYGQPGMLRSDSARRLVRCTVRQETGKRWAGARSEVVITVQAAAAVSGHGEGTA